MGRRKSRNSSGSRNSGKRLTSAVPEPCPRAKATGAVPTVDPAGPAK